MIAELTRHNGSKDPGAQRPNCHLTNHKPKKWWWFTNDVKYWEGCKESDIESPDNPKREVSSEGNIRKKSLDKCKSWI